MSVSFEQLRIDTEYDRTYLANIWGYAGPKGLERGIVTPTNDHHVILFVTKLKAPDQTNYSDEIIGSILVMDGEEQHGNDDRLIAAEQQGDTVYLFFREETRMLFTYFGKLRLLSYKKRRDQPSRFVFEMLDQ